MPVWKGVHTCQEMGFMPVWKGVHACLERCPYLSVRGSRLSGKGSIPVRKGVHACLERA